MGKYTLPLSYFLKSHFLNYYIYKYEPIFVTYPLNICLQFYDLVSTPEASAYQLRVYFIVNLSIFEMNECIVILQFMIFVLLETPFCFNNL